MQYWKMCSSCSCCLWVELWGHCRFPLPCSLSCLSSLPTFFSSSPFPTSPPSLHLLLLLLLFLMEIGLFQVTLLWLLYFAFNCCDNIRLVSSPDWNYILAFKKLLSRTRIGPGERKYVSDHLKLLKKIPLTQLCCPTHIFYP